jgi:hypothetical protein
MDDVNRYVFTRLYEKIDMDIGSFPFFLSADGNLLLLADASTEITEPDEASRSYYCRPDYNNSNAGNNQCTALVLVPDTNNPADSTDGIKAKGRVAEMVNLLEKEGFNPGTVSSTVHKKYHVKEKGLVIKVKKNEVEESKPNDEERLKALESIFPNEINNVENNSSILNKKIDYSDYEVYENRDGSINDLEPLI